MKKSIAFLFAVLFLTVISLVPVVMAQDLDMPTAEEVVEYIVTFIFGPGMPKEWYTWQKVMQFIIFPFIALFAVFYAIMEELHIFRTDAGKNAQKVIGIVMAFVAGKMLLATMRGFLIVNAWIAMIMFGLMLLLGTLFWGLRGLAHHGYGGAKRTWDEIKSLQKGIYDLEKKIAELEIELGDTRTPTSRKIEIRNELGKLNDELRKKREKIFKKEVKA